jgi:hypothetical protein
MEASRAVHPTQADGAQPGAAPRRVVRPTPIVDAPPIGGPTSSSWREQALTRVAELEDLTEVFRQETDDRWGILPDRIHRHLDAARRAAEGDATGRWSAFARTVAGSPLERTASNLDAAEAGLLRLAPVEYLSGQVPSLLAHVRAHLQAGDPRRERMEEIARRMPPAAIEGFERDVVVAAVRAASSAARREVVRVRSFRNVLYVSAACLTVAAVVLAVIGFARPDVIPLCFHPPGKVVCPMGETVASTGPGVDTAMRSTSTGWGMLVVEVLGLIAAAVASATALRSIRGTTTPYSLPVALALLKLPTGALTAVLGLLLMRGSFVPGLSALDSSGQILAWAIVFGYAQQAFTRLVDQRAHAVLDQVGDHQARATPAPLRTADPSG